jgi:TRAP transporter TAXI family solute receptor
MHLQYLIAVCIFMCALAANAMSQTAPRPSLLNTNPDATWVMPDRNRINEGTVTVITAPAGGATSVFGSDMARVLDDDASVRVLVILGKGPVRNVIDVLNLKSIDMGIVTSDVPEFYKLQYKVPDVTSRLRYIAMLYLNEVHIIARTSIKSVFDLEGKAIIAPTDVGYYAAKVILSRLNIKAKSFETQTDDTRSIQKLEDGAADAYVVSTGKPFQLALNIIKNKDRSLHLVPIPYDSRLEDLYLPTTLSGEEYPNLLSPGQKINTVAASQLLVTFDWPEKSERYNKVARFVDAFFSRIEDFRQPPRHPKWKEASIIFKAPGWQRFKAAEDWLVAHDMTSEKVKFEKFLADNPVPGGSDPAKRQILYRQFLEWKRNNPSR